MDINSIKRTPSHHSQQKVSTNMKTVFTVSRFVWHTVQIQYSILYLEFHLWLESASIQSKFKNQTNSRVTFKITKCNSPILCLLEWKSECQLPFPSTAIPLETMSTVTDANYFLFNQWFQSNKRCDKSSYSCQQTCILAQSSDTTSKANDKCYRSAAY